MRTDFVLDALEQTLYARQPGAEDGLFNHHRLMAPLGDISPAEAAATTTVNSPNNVGGDGEYRRLGE